MAFSQLIAVFTFVKVVFGPSVAAIFAALRPRCFFGCPLCGLLLCIFIQKQYLTIGYWSPIVILTTTQTTVTTQTALAVVLIVFVVLVIYVVVEYDW